MKKKTAAVLVAIALMLGAAISWAVFGATEDASTTLVSLDYVENTLKPWVREQTNGADGTYTVVYLTRGQKLLAQDSAEMVVRSGAANAVSPFSTQGLSDMTAGKELYDGDAAAVNHQILVPRGDGRGLIVTTSQAYIMVRGPYTVE